MDKLSLIISIFIIELLVDFLILKLFKIYYRKIYLLFLQIPKVCASVICFFCLKNIFACVLVKFLAFLLCIIFITDSFRIKKLLAILFLEALLLFSIFGFFVFLMLWVNSSFNDIFLQKIPQNCQIFTLFAIILYIFAVFRIVRLYENNKFLRKFLTKVSFSLNGKHIYLYGLIDSGNALFDPLTRKPVVLVSIDSLEKNFSKIEIEHLLKLSSRKIKCDTISGSGFEIPILKVYNF